ncbi:MAG: nucleotidyltransferase family protein [Gemmatimonadaceae bacterium]|nr:nucleotidyltransferase family protein [Acetobacteraceae bacterium]
MSGLNEALRALLRADPMRMRIVECLRTLRLPDAWVGAGVVRSAVWDHVHGRPPGRTFADVDVIWFDPSADRDDELDRSMHALEPDILWSVTNQAHIHAANGDPPYVSATDAMRFWPETATAVAVRLEYDDSIGIAAPFGLDDLFGLVLRPTPPFAAARIRIVQQRIVGKRWREIWPRLSVAPTDGAGASAVPASGPAST